MFPFDPGSYFKTEETNISKQNGSLKKEHDDDYLNETQNEGLEKPRKGKSDNDRVFHKFPDDVCDKNTETDDYSYEDSQDMLFDYSKAPKPFDPGIFEDDTDEEQPKDTHEKFFDVNTIESDVQAKTPKPFDTDPGIPTDIDVCLLFPFVPGIFKDKNVVFEGKETMDEPQDAEATPKDEIYSKNLVFDAKTNNFQPDLGSVVVSLQKIYSISVTHYRAQASPPFCQTIDYSNWTGSCVGRQSKLNEQQSNSSIITDSKKFIEVEVEVFDKEAKEAIGEEEPERKT
jgi:hypothetical protein